MDFKRLTDSLVQQTKTYFKSTGFSKAIIGLSGGKDSTVCAKLMTEALGGDNVMALYMPNTMGLPMVYNKEMKCYFDNHVSDVVETLGLKYSNVVLSPIGKAVQEELDSVDAFVSITKQTQVNVQPRVRMARLYAFAQSLGGTLVINTSNLDERHVGYSTIWGDSVGDFAPIQELHVSEVIEVGRTLGLPDELLFIPPSDGLSGKTDEENLGFPYKEVEGFINKIQVLFKKSELGALKAFDSFLKDAKELTGEVMLDPAFYTEHEQKILDDHRKNLFKWNAIHLAGCKKEN